MRSPPEKVGSDPGFAVIGKKVLVDDGYYSSSIANMKSVAGAIKRDVEKKYGDKVKPHKQ